MYEEITGKIIGCGMKVHSGLGRGFQEVIYQRCMAIEMHKQGLVFKREFAMPINYDGRRVGTRRVDFFVENTIMVELKAQVELDPAHVAQTFNYIEVYGVEVGLLLNFGARRLEYKRLHNNKLLKPSCC